MRAPIHFGHPHAAGRYGRFMSSYTASMIELKVDSIRLHHNLQQQQLQSIRYYSYAHSCDNAGY